MEILPLISFTTGVISILTPCILPILPIFVSVSLNLRTKDILSFLFGFISIFIAIIFLTGFFTSLIYSYISYVRVISAIVLLMAGILMLFDYSFNLKSKQTNNSFFLGVLTSIAWAPCYGGYLISLISLLVSSADVFYVVLNLIVYTIGFAVTLLVLSYLISKIDLEKLISKTRHIPKIFAILIIVGSVYLLYNSLIVFF
ncbi:MULTISPECIES: cytochrome c biogenesis protein CcdA [unclassified Methanobrevibacter]|uniref:cytochrome c biogenesis CcdA family protein n=1 Tax=unclassified Methanobrevibacter TaxID=2638681 RepID=UPI00273303E0|nr:MULTISPECIES: cytochrome c biogenesis protein CcdA [unclassified Methanobrevibacter]